MLKKYSVCFVKVFLSIYLIFFKIKNDNMLLKRQQNIPKNLNKSKEQRRKISNMP